MAGSGSAHLRAADDTLLRAENIVVEFPVGKTGMKVHAVSGVSLDVREGETLGLVGESGCGKSTTGRALMQLPRPTSGEILYRGHDLTDMSGPDLRRLRPEMQMIFQDPISSLNPRRRVGDIVAEPLRIWASEKHPPVGSIRLAMHALQADAAVRVAFFLALMIFLLVNGAIPGLFFPPASPIPGSGQVAASFEVLPSVDQWFRAQGGFLFVSALVFGLTSFLLAPSIRDRVRSARNILFAETALAVIVAAWKSSGGVDAASVVSVIGAALSAVATVAVLTPASIKDFRVMHDVRTEHAALVGRTLSNVGIDPEAAVNRRPHQFSGGQCQRICVARALVLDPMLIICDEPVSALDVSVQAQILNLLEDMKKRYGLTLVFIAHDLAVVKNVSDRVAVMYLGKLCEVAPPDELYLAPSHPYTAALLNSIPVPDPSFRPDTAGGLAGELPSPVAPPSGCRFRTRCPKAQELCEKVEPEMRPIAPEHFVACHFPLAGEPAVQPGGSADTARQQYQAATDR
jgi:oligopeptide/dipeptide ABC transporter ATP-binding protein